MKKVTAIIIILLFCINVIAQRELPEYLLKLEGVVKIDTLENSDFYKEKYCVWFQQKADYNNNTDETFLQRVFISHKGFDNNVTYICEGYNGDYGEKKGYINELSHMFKTNQILVEHRYFNKSVPESFNWDYLTTYNASSDHHSIFEKLNNIYKNKWMATGISKGGETTLLYGMYYPNDMDAWISYVGPVAKSVEEKAHMDFISKTGSKKERKKIHKYLVELLKRKEQLLPLFNEYIAESNYTFQIPVNEIYDYCILEFEFAFRQWGISTDRIPDLKSTDQKLFNFFITVSSPSYFAVEDIKPTLPFFIQAARELGYYAYNPELFKKYMDVKSSEGYLNKIFIPKDIEIKYMPETAINLEKYLQTTAKNTVLIFGDFDPWTASRVDVSMNQNVKDFTKEGGSHATRINSFDKETKQEIIDIINAYIK